MPAKKFQDRKSRMEAGFGLILKIQSLEAEAMSAGFFITQRSLNRAKNALGWEISGNLEMADKYAKRGDL